MLRGGLLSSRGTLMCARPSGVAEARMASADLKTERSVEQSGPSPSSASGVRTCCKGVVRGL